MAQAWSDISLEFKLILLKIKLFQLSHHISLAVVTLSQDGCDTQWLIRGCLAK